MSGLSVVTRRHGRTHHYTHLLLRAVVLPCTGLAGQQVGRAGGRLLRGTPQQRKQRALLSQPLYPVVVVGARVVSLLLLLLPAAAHAQQAAAAAGIRILLRGDDVVGQETTHRPTRRGDKRGSPPSDRDSSRQEKINGGARSARAR